VKSQIDFRTPGAGFDQPIEMWLACHERVQRFAALLGRLSDHLQKSGNDHDAQTSASSIRRYFNEAAPNHHEDEEVDMLPRLRSRLTEEAHSKVLEVIDQITADHAEMTRLWQQIDAALEQVEQGRSTVLPRPSIDHFIALYQHHIDAEERVLLPAMKRAFRRADWREIGRAMAARRGLDFDEAAPAPRRAK
jgi:pyridoxamine 5'-phosphate oxidase